MAESIPCRCGRVRDCVDGLIINETKHESVNRKDGFCGPIIAHDLRDADAEAASLRAQLAGAREKLAAAELDTKRLDWLSPIEDWRFPGFVYNRYVTKTTLRQAIDASIAADLPAPAAEGEKPGGKA